MILLQYCMIEHFYETPWKLLCCPKTEISDAVKILGDEDLQALRELPSFRCYVDSLPKKEKAPLLLDNDHFRVSLCNMRSNCLKSEQGCRQSTFIPKQKKYVKMKTRKRLLPDYCL